MNGRFEGKVAVVTGGASGIGLATVERLAREGARVLLTDWSERRGPPAAERLTQLGLDVSFQHHDAGEEASWLAVRQRLEADYPRLDVLVNNAYSGAATSIETLSAEALRSSMRVNVEGALMGLRLAADLMGEGGAVVNLSSVAAFRAMPGNVGYATAKLALLQITMSAALAYATRPAPIRVNAVAPGNIETPAMVSALRAFTGAGRDDDLTEAKQKLAALAPVNRLGRPEEIAAAIAFLASDDASYITGQCITVDGGMVLR